MTIHINQAGYLPESEKIAVMPFPAESFKVVDADGKTVFEGTCARFGFDENSGDTVWKADFSELRAEGEYRVVSDDATSPLFKIGRDALDKTLRGLVRAYYYFRCGCELKPENAGKFTHGACHTTLASEWFDSSVKKDVSGGWHDAGDYGRYVTPGACAAAQLMYAYILYPNALGKLNLNIPESGNNMPDFLSEVRYELDWLMKMQKADGAVYHKVSTAQHARFVMPERDLKPLYLLPVSSMATADLAAVCALGYRVYKEFDSDYAEKLLDTAKLSLKWLDENLQFIGFRNPEGCGTGGYGEGGDKDNRFWAYSEMFAATGDEKYLEKAKELLVYDFPRTEFGVGSIGGLGALAYLTSGRSSEDDKLAEAFKSMFVNQAHRLRWLADRSGYMAAMDERDYGWGSNMGLMKYGMIFAVCDTLCSAEGDAHEFGVYAKRQFDVLMGVNAVGMSYVSGNGERAIRNPHLRPAAADGIDECIPGMVSGGANRRPVEEIAHRYIPKGTPPMKSFADVQDLYSVNEVTIYWNSPAVFVAAYLLN
ncbi:MAG: glycoside hydrolase family 9 protein [Oscillospiraceae bacterium]|nr:glycoside hydrolase family 9 protein [Oscillospiraceae bacterium]